ncbi:uncharacterized protein si:dkey-79d12.4 isoform X3 [Neoarius graeffei]|uniref:uncharacterized protein si:dkey-79d12.4 isoform X3 n=1 Tax=Neoarius graeffei TaxID=443677 RepID=UPI00298C42F7|nr:uncharacterized protein si:dkey-79d12.4 isoform X3 [Neoarius graeffei]
MIKGWINSNMTGPDYKPTPCTYFRKPKHLHLQPDAVPTEFLHNKSKDDNRQQERLAKRNQPKLCSAVAMEIASKEMARALGPEPQQDENTVQEQNECKVTWSVPKTEEDVLGGSIDDGCCICGGRFAFNHVIKHGDEMCCHLCQMKFSHIDSLTLHLKNGHPGNYRTFCKSCTVYMRRHLPKVWSVETDKSTETPKEEILDEEVEEVIIEEDEVEVKYVKEEEEEEEVVGIVGRTEEAEENRITETPEDKTIINTSLHDQSYFSGETSRETTNNVVMYTSSENVLVFVNKTDNNRISPIDSYTEHDQQGTPVDNQMVCSVIHDHTYFSTQSLANQAPNTCSSVYKTSRDVTHSSTDHVHVFNNKADTRMSLKDPESTESIQEQTWTHELVYRSLLDHNYVLRQNLADCTVLSKQVPCRSGTHEAIKEKLLKKQNHRGNVGMTLSSSAAMLESSQLKDNIKVEKDLHEFEPIQQEDGGEYEESIRRSRYDDHDPLCIGDLVSTSQDDMNSDTLSCTSTDYEYFSEDDHPSESWSACRKQDSENTNQKSLNSVDSNPSTSSGKDLQICPCCGLSKVPNPEKSTKRCTCAQSFPCALSGSVHSTEQMRLNHQAKNHPSTKYVCVRCLQLFPNQNVFMQHICSKSSGISGESLTPCKSSKKAEPPVVMILNVVPSPTAESSTQSISSQRVSIMNTVQNLGTGSDSISRSLPNSPSISANQEVTATKLSGYAQEKNAPCLVLNGHQGQVMTLVSTAAQKQIGQMKVLRSSQAKVVTQTPSSSSISTQLQLSSQGQQQMAPTSLVTPTEHGQMQTLTPLQPKVVTHTPPGNAELTTSITFPQQHPPFGVHLPKGIVWGPVLPQVLIPSQTGQLPESNIPFLDICRSSPSSQIIPSSQGPLQIVAMFVNQSKEMALQKRMLQSWRSKAVFPCRQCGAVSRQFSLGVRHRYQHRGPRIHRCQCGRTFQQRMHLLRHQVQHAEATRYVCAACGQMFCGTQQLACHRPFFRIAQSNRKKQANKQCRNIFQCYCGHSFMRPAALLWHMLKNSKAHKPCLKGFRRT